MVAKNWFIAVCTMYTVGNLILYIRYTENTVVFFDHDDDNEEDDDNTITISVMLFMCTFSSSTLVM